MVADPAFRRRGLGEEAVQLLLGYAGTRGLNRFVAKVGSTNAPSLALFEKRLGFSRTAFVEAFDEVHLELEGAEEGLALGHELSDRGRLGIAKHRQVGLLLGLQHQASPDLLNTVRLLRDASRLAA